MTALVLRVGRFLLPLPGLVLCLSCSDASDREPKRRYVISEAAVFIPADTEVQVLPNADFTVHALSNRRLNTALGIYEGFSPDFERDSEHEYVGNKERIGGFPAWRVAQNPPGYCGADILVESSRYRDAFNLETVSYLHFFYQSSDREACREAEQIVRSLQAK